MEILSIVKGDLNRNRKKNVIKPKTNKIDIDIRNYKKEIIEQFKEKPTTEQILQQIINNAKTSGYEIEKDEQEDILKNIIRNIFNNSAKENINKKDVEDISSNKKTISEYKISVNSIEEMFVKYGKDSFKVPDNIKKLIYLTKAYKNEIEIAECFEENVEHILDMYNEICKDIEGGNVSEYKIEEFLMIAEDLLRTLNSLNIKNDKEKEKIKIYKEKGKYIAKNEVNKSLIELDFKSKIDLEKLQNKLMEIKFWKYIYKKINSKNQPNGAELSYSLYSYIRDLGIKIKEIHEEQTGNNMIEFEFGFGGKREIDIDDFRKIYSIPALPYTEEMIGDYEYCYSKKYGYSKFMDYINNKAKESIDEKIRNREIKIVERNYDKAVKKYNKIDRKSNIKRPLHLKNHQYVVTNLTIKESKKLLNTAICLEEFEKERMKKNKKRTFKRKCIDVIEDLLVINDEDRVEELIEKSLRRIGEDVKDIVIDNKRMTRVQSKIQNAGTTTDTRMAVKAAKAKRKKQITIKTTSEPIRKLSNAKYENDNLEK